MKATTPHTLIAAAHELKTPLTIISHLAAALHQLDESAQRQALERIRLSADRSLRLVNGLTLAYRLEQTDQLALQFQLEPINALQLCEEALHEMTPFAAAHDQQLRLRSHRSQLVVANRELLYCTMFNLLDNAVRHSQAQSVIDLQLRRRQQWVRLAVHDTGPGVSRRDFRQLRRTIGTRPQPLSGQSQTSGLGLYIAGRLASVMGGQLGVGRPEAGSQFFIDVRHSAQLTML